MFGIDDIVGAGLKILDKVIPDPAEKAKGDFKKQLIANSVKSMSSAPQMAQPQLKIINAQQAFAQMPDATQPQQVQEFKPDQMAMMLRKRYGSV